jgi:uncharacterized SAM-dependent methyltransferase
MQGTYDDGLKFLRNGGLAGHKLSEETSHHLGSETSDSEFDTTSQSLTKGHEAPLHIMFLGSTLGNFTRSGATSFLRSLPLRPYHGDTLLLGLDHDNDKDLIESAYDDPQGYTKRFIFNGLRAAGRAMGDENMFDEAKWDYETCYDVVSFKNSSDEFNKTDDNIQAERKLCFLLKSEMQFLVIHIQVNIQHTSSRNATKMSMIPTTIVRSHS